MRSVEVNQLEVVGVDAVNNGVPIGSPVTADQLHPHRLKGRADSLLDEGQVDVSLSGGEDGESCHASTFSAGLTDVHKPAVNLRRRNPYRFSHRAGDTYYWRRPAPGFGPAYEEVVSCNAAWFWGRS